MHKNLQTMCHGNIEPAVLEVLVHAHSRPRLFRQRSHLAWHLSEVQELPWQWTLSAGPWQQLVGVQEQGKVAGLCQANPAW